MTLNLRIDLKRMNDSWQEQICNQILEMLTEGVTLRWQRYKSSGRMIMTSLLLSYSFTVNMELKGSQRDKKDRKKLMKLAKKPCSGCNICKKSNGLCVGFFSVRLFFHPPFHPSIHECN